MRILDQLTPQPLWRFFEDISQIPRASKKEEKIVAYIVSMARSSKLKVKKDKVGNILVSKPATPGYEHLKTVVLQSHVDMVCEKNEETSFNFDTDPIGLKQEGEWLKAKDTTLGADNGIGVAAQLALLTATNVEHGPIECLFTIDEEAGMTGAARLEPGFFEGKILLNLDSEDEGEIYIGCAGGVDTVATMDFKIKVPANDALGFKMTLTGLKGGHSGADIHLGLGNSIKLLNRFLWSATKKFDIRLGSFEGGNLRNAIPREATARFSINPKHKEKLLAEFEQFNKAIVQEWATVEPHLSIRCEQCLPPEFVMNRKAQFGLLGALYACPHGTMAMSNAMPDLVETSTNLASVRFIGHNQVQVTTSQRSSIDSKKDDIAAMVLAAFKLGGFSVAHGDGYPGWMPRTDSDILETAQRVHAKLFGRQANVKAIHAGLECGMFLTKYPDLDMISFGPTIKGAHTPEEKVHVPSVARFWDYLNSVLVQVPSR